ncbi:MAG TPA: penicillin-binding transpeptidase domain-containing protein [Actinomycetota bacterium]|nr:penicillin-binding transpeptidase domain-containing protein [Actinomycetota bacterium]
MERSSARLKVFAILVLVMFAALSTRLWFLQVLATQVYAQEAQNNGVRSIPIDALRGEIWTEDQYGKPKGVPLVKNRSSLEVRIDKQELEESGRGEQVLGELATMLDVPVKQLRADLESTKYFDYQPKPVAEFVPEEVAFAIRERQEDFPGVQVRNTSVREYPMGRTASHMLGWVGQVQAGQLETARFRDYGPNDLAGQAGLEVQYERWLRGVPGLQRYVVNSDDERIRDLGGREPTAGGDVVLAINSEWQRAAEEYLQDSIFRTRQVWDEDTQSGFKADAGVVIVLDVATGGVKAMASWPDFDPRWYVTGLTKDQECYLGYDPECPGANKVAPLLDRAYQEVYLPGSTFKPFTALAAVKEGYADLGTSYACPSEYVHPGDTSGASFSNWSDQDLYPGNLAQHLRISCDSSFYAWGSDFWYRYQNDQLGADNEPLQKDLRAWGFEKPTGIDLPNEAVGFLPDAEWGNDPEQRQLFPEGWNPGGYILTMIGSGYMSVTPLQLATAYGAIANEGHMCRPHLVDRVMAGDGETVLKKVNGQCDRTVPYSKTELDYVRNALAQVPLSGTARSAFYGFPHSEVPVAGKTGTAFRGEPFQDTSWFAAMVPANDPEYVVVAMVEQAGFGSDVAAPLVRRMIEKMYGIEPGGQIITPSGQD